MKVRTHRFNGVKYYIEVDDPYIAWCDRPKSPDKAEYPRIAIPNGLPCGNDKLARLGLISLIHECLHAEDWETHEDTVDRVATEIGGLLWRLNYRRKRSKK